MNLNLMIILVYKLKRGSLISFIAHCSSPVTKIMAFNTQGVIGAIVFQ